MKLIVFKYSLRCYQFCCLLSEVVFQQMSRKQLISKYAKESNCTPPSTVQNKGIAGAVCLGDRRGGIHNQKHVMDSPLLAAVSVGAERVLQKGHYDTECA